MDARVICSSDKGCNGRQDSFERQNSCAIKRSSVIETCAYQDLVLPLCAPRASLYGYSYPKRTGGCILDRRGRRLDRGSSCCRPVKRHVQGCGEAPISARKEASLVHCSPLRVTPTSFVGREVLLGRLAECGRPGLLRAQRISDTSDHPTRCKKFQRAFRN